MALMQELTKRAEHYRPQIGESELGRAAVVLWQRTDTAADALGRQLAEQYPHIAGFCPLDETQTQPLSSVWAEASSRALSLFSQSPVYVLWLWDQSQPEPPTAGTLPEETDFLFDCFRTRPSGVRPADFHVCWEPERRVLSPSDLIPAVLSLLADSGRQTVGGGRGVVYAELFNAVETAWLLHIHGRLKAVLDPTDTARRQAQTELEESIRDAAVRPPRFRALPMRMPYEEEKTGPAAWFRREAPLRRSPAEWLAILYGEDAGGKPGCERYLDDLERALADACREKLLALFTPAYLSGLPLSFILQARDHLSRLQAEAGTRRTEAREALRRTLRTGEDFSCVRTDGETLLQKLSPYARAWDDCAAAMAEHALWTRAAELLAPDGELLRPLAERYRRLDALRRSLRMPDGRIADDMPRESDLSEESLLSCLPPPTALTDPSMSEVLAAQGQRLRDIANASSDIPTVELFVGETVFSSLASLDGVLEPNPAGAGYSLCAPLGALTFDVVRPAHFGDYSVLMARRTFPKEDCGL